jgi:phenylalanine ammonia-lyase
MCYARVRELSSFCILYLLTTTTALDLRVMQDEFLKALDVVIAEELSSAFGSTLGESQLTALLPVTMTSAHASFAQTANMDADGRLFEIMGAVSKTLVEVLTFSASGGTSDAISLTSLGAFRSAAATRGASLLKTLRRAYLTGERGAAPAAPYLKGTRPVYEFVRATLGIRMHGKENLDDFEKGLGVEDVTIGENVSLIYEVRLELGVPPVQSSYLLCTPGNS